jgi:uncharacterized protein YndB with AHSA1/START domain
MTSDKKPAFVHVSYIASTMEKVFAALTDGKFTEEYWGGKIVESDWKKGSEVRFHDRGTGQSAVYGVVLECDPPSLLSYTWTQTKPGATGPATKVTFQLKQASPNNVRLQVTHEEHEAGGQVPEMVREGWAAVMSSLKSYLETGQALEATKLWAKQAS